MTTAMKHLTKAEAGALLRRCIGILESADDEPRQSQEARRILRALRPLQAAMDRRESELSNVRIDRAVGLLDDAAFSPRQQPTLFQAQAIARQENELFQARGAESGALAGIPVDHWVQAIESWPGFSTGRAAKWPIVVFQLLLAADLQSPQWTSRTEMLRSFLSWRREAELLGLDAHVASLNLATGRRTLLGLRERGEVRTQIGSRSKYRQ